ncbi:MAG: O-antigen ligase family protein [Akkermansiaceae bacterium]
MITYLLEKLTILLVSLGLLFAFVLGTTRGLPLQSPTLMLLAVAGLIGAFGCFDKKLMGLDWLGNLVIISIGYFVVRAYYSPVVDFARDDLYLIFAATLFYLVAGYTNGTAQMRVSLLWIVFAGLCLHLGSVFLQLQGGDGYWPFQWFADVKRPDRNVITGMYGYRGSLGNFAAVAALVSFSLAIMGRYQIVLRVAFSLIGCASAAAVIFSDSRAAVVALVMGGLILFILLWLASSAKDEKYRAKFRVVVVVIGLLAITCTSIGMYVVFKDRAYNKESGIDVFFVDSARGHYWPMAIEQIKEMPLVGGGSRSFSYECFQNWNPNLTINSLNPDFVHNEYLQAATDYGLIGLSLLLLILGGHFYLGVKRTRELASKMKELGVERSNELALCIAGVTGMTVMAVHVIFDFRTHLQANLLLLTCCLVWVLPVKLKLKSVSNKKHFLTACLLLCFMLPISIVSGYMAYTEFRAGIPLLEQKMALETGSWDPTKINPVSGAKALEEAIAIAPSYRRHLKLGTVFHLESQKIDVSDTEKMDLMEKAIKQYQLAERRNRFDPVAKTNLGKLYGALGQYSESESYFKAAYQLAGVRADRWFDVRISWATMIYQKALSHWENDELELANQYFDETDVMLLEIKNHVRWVKWRPVYNMNKLSHLKLLLQMKRFDAAADLIKTHKTGIKNKREQINQFYIGDYYLAKGHAVWYQRKPSEAMSLFLLAQKNYLNYKKELNGKVDEKLRLRLDNVGKKLQLFRDAGITPAKQSAN